VQPLDSMDGEIELDDIRVVNITGKTYRDKPRKREDENKCWNPSLRLRIILIFSAIALIFVASGIAVIFTMQDSLEELDIEALRDSINRFTMLYSDDVVRLQPYNKHAAWQKVTAEAAMHASRNTSDKMFYINQFVQRYLNTSVIYDEDGTAKRVYRCGSLVNWWGIIDNTTYTTVWSDFHPGNDKQFCSLKSAMPWEPQPYFPEGFFMSVFSMTRERSRHDQGWLSIFRPARLAEAMTLSIETIRVPDENGNITDDTVYGYLVAAQTTKYHLSALASSVPGCISMISSDEDELEFDETDMKMWQSSRNGTFSDEKTFTGIPKFIKRETSYLKKCKVRYCPPIPLFHDTEEMMTGYFTLCGQDPEKVKERNTCLRFRMDRPLSRIEEGSTPVIMLSVLILLLIAVLFILFIIFLDIAVLRRVVNLSNTIRKQTLKQRDTFKDVDERTAKLGSKKGKNLDDDNNGPTGGDEIKNLKLAVEQNTYRLRKRLEAINDVVKLERQRILRHKQAMQLLSLWCDRNEFFPGLRPNAVLLRYEPTRSLDDLFSNPLAIEYLKSHCDTDCTLENLFFLLDVSWLSELEAAEDGEDDMVKRGRIHDVVTDTAASIVARYIAADAPQQINISAATFQVLRGKSNTYKRDMFKDAVAEVKLMLDTDILPRFQSTTAYTAMSENLYIDSFAYADDSDLSSESVSTAGSVLSDEVEAGPSNMVAFNFRNLYATFDGDTDLGSTCTNDLSIIDDGPTDSTMPEAGNRPATVSSSEKNNTEKEDATDSDESEHNDTSSSEAKEKPAKKEETKKDDSDSSESSDSSAHSMSSDLMSSDSSSSSSN